MLGKFSDRFSSGKLFWVSNIQVYNISKHEIKKWKIMGVFREIKWRFFREIFENFRNVFPRDLWSVWYLMIVCTVKSAKTRTASVKLDIVHRRNQVGSFVDAASPRQ